MTAIILSVMAVLLIGAVVVGFVVNNNKSGKPSQGHDNDGTPRPSS